MKKMPAVKRIFEIKYRRAGPDPQHQIWPELKGCDGVVFLDKAIQCPAGAKLYYGSPKKPVVTAKTTVAKDTKMKVSANGNASVCLAIKVLHKRAQNNIDDRASFENAPRSW